jgi:hypothetical protein
MDPPNYTRIAARAVSLAELVEARFQHGLDGPAHFRVELSAPEGPSTAGGLQALQHLKLVPDVGGTTIVFGAASTTRYAAEIRTFAHIEALYRQRFKGATIPIDETRYRALAEELAAFFGAMKMTVTFSEPVANGLSRAHRRRRRWPFLVLLGLMLVVSVCAAYTFAHRA